MDNRKSDLIGSIPEPGRTEPAIQRMTAGPFVLPMGTQPGNLHTSDRTNILVRPSQPLEETAQNVPGEISIRRADVIGRVIAVEHSHTEPPVFDVFRAITRLLWGLLLLTAPFILLGHVFLLFGPLSVVAAVIGIVFLLRVFSLANILWMVHIFGGSGRAPEQVPVWYARVRGLDDESEVMVRLKGLYSRGNISPDDVVAFWGSWRDGVMVARRGFNYRTQSQIMFRRSKWWIHLMLTLFLIAGLAMYFHTAWSHLVGNVAR